MPFASNASTLRPRAESEGRYAFEDDPVPGLTLVERSDGPGLGRSIVKRSDRSA